MTYRVFYGESAALAGRDLQQDQEVRSERFSTEFEALRRARDLLDADPSAVVAVSDAAGNLVSGVCLHLRLGYCCT